MVDKKLRENLILFLVLVLLLYFVSAAHLITTPTSSFDEDTSILFNITVNNTDINSTANISQMDVILPATFTFTINTNGTDAGTHTFSNTSTVLTWSNDGLVMNSSFNYFWFNLTASSPGSYNITVNTTNATGIFSTNLGLTVNDINGPSVTLISPANETSSTTTSYNFTFNVTDDVGIDNCSLFIDGAVDTNSSTIANATTTGLVSSTLSVGSHTWLVSCIDSSSNQANSSSRVVTITSEDSSGGGSESSEGDGSLPEFSITKSELEKGVRRELGRLWILNINLNGRIKKLIIDKLDYKNNEVTFSSPQLKVLKIGEEWKIDADTDGKPDLSVKLEKVTSIRATLFIKSISESVASQTTKSTTPKTNEDTGGIQTSPKEKSILPWVLIIILTVGALVMFLRNRNNKIKKQKLNI